MYASNAEVIEVTIRDSSGRKVDNFRCKPQEFAKFVPVLKNKYGVKFNEQVEKKLKKDSQIDKDLEWLRKI